MVEPVPVLGNGAQTSRQLAAEETPADRIFNGTNGNGKARASAVEQILTEHITYTYRPNLPVYGFRDEYWTGPEFYYDVEAMLQHDAVTTPMAYVMAPLSQMQISCKGSSTRVVRFLLDEWTKFKERWLYAVQYPSYSYGWMGAELVYAVERGLLVQKEFHDFAPRDVQPLVSSNTVVGLQVTNVTENSGELSGSDKGFPAKGFWYPHRAVYGKHYGQSQLRGAWKPWRRLTGRDGLEEVMDIAIHRYGTGQVVVRAPLGDIKSSNSPIGTQERTSMMQRAREMAESIKAGGAIAMPSDSYPDGKPKWELDSFQPQMNLSELIQGAEYLEKKISKAIFFPPELLEAADTGSGYSGRMIPLQGFLMVQQNVAQAIFFAWLTQIGEPLVKWNFGPNAIVKCQVVPLLKSFRQASQPQPPMPQPGAPQGGPQQPQAMPQPGPDGKTPYQGPRGGRGYTDAQGRVHYTHMMSTDSRAMLVAAKSLENGMSGDEERNLRRLVKMLPNLEADELDVLAAAIESDALVGEDDEPTPRFVTLATESRTGELREVGTAIANALKHLPQPIVNVDVKPPSVEVHPPTVNFSPTIEAPTIPRQPDVNVHVDAPIVNVAAPKAPIVNVAAPEVHLPEIRVPQQEPPVVNVHVERPKPMTKDVDYDKDGKVKRIVEKESA